MLISTIILAAEDLGPNPIAPENKELFWGAGSFLVFLFVMRVFLVPKVRKGMEARYNAIRGGHESAQAARGAAQRDVAAYEAALAEVRAEATARIDAARQTLGSRRKRCCQISMVCHEFRHMCPCSSKMPGHRLGENLR
jgi:F-type H+-transporting ATPase subunit b